MHLDQDHLRVTKPMTIDGINLKYDANKQLVTKTFLLPLTAKRPLEQQNLKLPHQLRLTIEVVKGHAVQRPLPQVPQIPDGAIITTQAEMQKMIAEQVAAALKAQQSAPPDQTQTPPPKGTGKPPAAPVKTSSAEETPIGLAAKQTANETV